MKRWGRALLQAVAILLPALALYAWQTRDLLPADARSDAPVFDLATIDGTRLDSAALSGRPAVLYFFAPWCRFCAASAPQLRWFHRFRGDAVAVVLVALDYGTAAQVQAYVDSHGLDMPVLLGESHTAESYRVRGFPTYYVVDSAGRVAARDFGITTLPGLWWRTLGL